MTQQPQRIAIIGAGPIGLEAALYAVRAGYAVSVFEAGTVAHNLKRWGHVKLFSSFGLNVSVWGRGAVADLIGDGELPDDSALLTGNDFVRRYLLPLSQTPELADCLHENTRVVSIGRSRLWKQDLIGKQERQRSPFQLLLKDDDGERVVEADLVLDCSGTYGNHNYIGAGGILAVGERDALAESDYLLPDVLGKDRERFAGLKTLVVGSGYSAATSVVSLAQLAADAPGTRVVWLTRSECTPPMPRIEQDALAERDQLSEAANQLALDEKSPIEWYPASLVKRVVFDKKTNQYQLAIEQNQSPAGQGGGEKTLVVDQVVANVGYKPDRNLYEELQVHECYASQGPMKLAAALLGETSADCLSQSSTGAETLCHPEPGFFILGSKSYGRDSRFLLKIGIQQIEDLFGMLDGAGGSR